VKPLLTATLALFLATLLGACATPANRRKSYTPQTTEGPYTKMLRNQR